MSGTAPHEPPAVLIEACRRLNADPADAELLHQHSNTSYALPCHRLVVRIAASATAFPRIAGSLNVTRWLASRGFPTVRPADIPGQPWRIRDRTVSIWHLESLAPDQHTAVSDLARLLRILHDQTPPFRVRALSDPLESVASALETAPAAIPTDTVRWLRNRVQELRRQWRAIAPDTPTALIHGDAHPNNLLQRANGEIILCDWDHTALGPPEWDLVQPLYTHRRFGYPGPEELQNFYRAYGRDLRDHPHAHALLSIRELTGLSPYIRNAASDEWSLNELGKRVQTLRHPEVVTYWQPPPKR